MATDTKIEWADKTWNIVRGCERVSAGCQNCYAEKIAYRFSQEDQPYYGLATKTKSGPRWTGNIMEVPELLKSPMKWKTSKKIFVNSMSDLFHENVSVSFILDVFNIIRECSHHTFQILTKRPIRMKQVIEDIYRCYPGIPALDNLWLGVSCEDQKTAGQRIPILLETPSSIRFVSCEPLLEKIDLTNYLSGSCKIDWIIAGSESGTGARPMDEDWARVLRNDAVASSTPFFYKQKLNQNGIKISLPMLDGKQWAEFPK